MKNDNFKNWCTENNHEIFLERWDYELNNIKPEDITTGVNTKIYFKCENGLHQSYPVSISQIVRRHKIPSCPICGSFGMWCENNNRLDLLKRWDYDLNDISPYEISISSTKKQYFKCPRGIHESELKDLNNIRKQYGSGRCCQCDSIGQFGIDNIDIDFIDKYWGKNNDQSPMDINKFSKKKIWIKCQNNDYHGEYDISACNFQKGKRCPFCSGKRVHIMDSLGMIYPNTLELWSDKNKINPYNILPMSNKFAYFKCENDKHDEYRRTVCASVNADFKCPTCIRERKQSILQEKVNNYISSLYTDIRHEYNCTLLPRNPSTNRILPYDNEIVVLKLIIEVNGLQHYSEHSYNSYYKNKGKSSKECLEERRFLDSYKMKYALDHGYYFLEIPYWTNDKKDTWKYLIDNKIKEITKIA